ncbi:hypothetical protein [Tenacibaculum sp. A30]|uniref:hypothetical protein n=1 Tax=Tenacibaculum sp. A30 TaxID=3442644 RepID=UPI003EBBBA49
MKQLHTIVILLLVQIGFSQTEDLSTKKVWTLEDCITYAIENNITIKDAALDKSQADVNYFETKSSRLPNLTGSASQSFTNGNSIDPITSDYVSDQKNGTINSHFCFLVELL